jgi:hypothetical protein
MSLNQAIVLYDNLMRTEANTVSYSGSEVSGFEVENAYDWRDFSLFRAATGTTTVDTLLAAATTMDTAVVWTADRGVSGTIVLKTETAAGSGVFTTQATFSLSASGESMLIATFASVTVALGAKVRWEVQAGAAVLDIKQLCVGVRLTNPIGQYVGQTPPNLFQGVVTTNVIAVNGSIIGRNYRRLERRDELKWDYLDPAWLRTYWEPFARHAARNAFFYQWAPSSYPLEVVMASAESIVAPENMMPPPKMKVSMPVRALVAAT